MKDTTSISIIPDCPHMAHVRCRVGADDVGSPGAQPELSKGRGTKARSWPVSDVLAGSRRGLLLVLDRKPDSRMPVGRRRTPANGPHLTSPPMPAAPGLGGKVDQHAIGLWRPLMTHGRRPAGRPGAHFSMCHDPSQSDGGGFALKLSMRPIRAFAGPSPDIASSEALNAASASLHRRSR